MSTQSLQGVQHVWCQGHTGCLQSPAEHPQISAGVSPGKVLRSVGTQVLPLSHKLHVLIVLVAQQLLSTGQLFSVTTKQSRAQKHFLCYLRKSKWSSNVWALLHKVC